MAVGSMNWLPRSSSYGELQNWHAKMAEHNSRFTDTLSGFGDTLLSAPVTETSSTLEITTQQMVNRMRTEALKKAQAAAKAAATERGTRDPRVYKPPASDHTDGKTGKDMTSLINNLSASVRQLIVVNKTV